MSIQKRVVFLLTLIIFTAMNFGGIVPVDAKKMTSNEKKRAYRANTSDNGDDRYPYTKWSNSEDNFGTPAVGQDGSIYSVQYNSITDDTPMLFAFDPDGNVKWKVKSPTDGVVVVDSNDTIYVKGMKRLAAFKTSGKLKWDYEYKSFAPVILPEIGPDGTLYLRSGYSLYAISPDGETKWVFKPQDDYDLSFAKPIITKDGYIYLLQNPKSTVDSNYLLKINPNGTLESKINLQKWFYNITAIETDYDTGDIYIIDSWDLYAFDKHGKYKWMITSNETAFNGLIVNTKNHCIYVMNDDKIDIFSSTGKKESTLRGNYDVYLPPGVDSKGNVYITDSHEGIQAYDRFHNLLWEYRLFPRGFSFSSDGTIYLNDYHHGLMAIGFNEWGYIDRLYMQPNVFLIPQGESYPFQVFAHYYSGKTKEVTNDAKVIYNDEKAIRIDNASITALKVGNSDIRIEYDNYFEHNGGIAFVYKKGDLGKFTLNPQKILTTPEKKVQLRLSVTYKGQKIDVTNLSKWTSADPQIAEVTNGLVSTKSEGTTVITAEYDSRKFQIPVDVQNDIKKIKKVTASNSKITLEPNKTHQVTLSAVYDDGTTSDVTALAKWTSSQNKVVTVNKGLIEAVGKGTSTITAEYRKKKYQIRVTVK